MKIIFIDYVDPLLKDELEKRNNICDTAYYKTKEEIESIISKYDGIIIRSRFPITKTFIDKAKKLKFIARAGSGLENINLAYAKKKNIKCYNAPEGNKQAVAEHATGLLLALLNKIINCDQQIRAGIWEREKNRGIEICGKTVGIIGYGNTGSSFAKILNILGAKVLAYDKYKKDHLYKASLNEIYNEADILSLHIPLNNETNYLVNDEFISRFKKNFYLINTSRGRCLKTASLISALKEGKIKGACLDVIEYEKKSFENLNDLTNKDLNYLIKSDKTVLTPHIAGWSQESNKKIANILLNKIIAGDNQ